MLLRGAGQQQQQRLKVALLSSSSLGGGGSGSPRSSNSSGSAGAADQDIFGDVMAAATAATSAAAAAAASGALPKHAAARLKLDELFLAWVALPEAQRLVLQLLEDAREGRPLAIPPQQPASSPAAVTPGAQQQSPLSLSAGGRVVDLFGPPVSPKKANQQQQPLQQPLSPPKSPLAAAEALALAFAVPTTTLLTSNNNNRRRHSISEPRPPQLQQQQQQQAGEEEAQRPVPQFYWPDGRPEEAEAMDAEATRLEALFTPHDEAGGMPLQDFATSVVRDALNLPAFFARPLAERLATSSSASQSQEGQPADSSKPPPERTTTGPRVTAKAFMSWWRGNKVARMDTEARIVEVLRAPGHTYLTKEDWRPVMRELLDTHPGLEFLHDTPEFQERYAETVIYRVFYGVNRAGNGRMTSREMRRSNLAAALRQVDAEEDINRVLAYFSYEHFYVIYCKFWELDTDHDFLIDREDLLRYGNHALTYRVVDRVFAQAPRRFSRPPPPGSPPRMAYEDFVWFILCEEDKTTELSLEYWFRCVDLDGDGAITPSEMHYFYEEQLHRMECLSQEPVLFEDVVCQMADMIGPAAPGRITLADLKRCRLAGNFFNVLFNLNKFIAFETRDPFLIRQEREDPSLTDWDRFARSEYVRLSMEEGEDASNGSAEVWEESLEAPF